MLQGSFRSSAVVAALFLALPLCAAAAVPGGSSPVTSDPGEVTLIKLSCKCPKADGSVLLTSGTTVTTTIDPSQNFCGTCSADQAASDPDNCFDKTCSGTTVTEGLFGPKQQSWTENCVIVTDSYQRAQ